jgi:hypothetical protein
MFFKKYQQQEEISKIRRPGVVANFIYKVVELGTYTYAFVTDAINILTGNTLNTGSHSVSTWGENVETEELPPPYDNSWSMVCFLIIVSFLVSFVVQSEAKDYICFRRTMSNSVT